MKGKILLLALPLLFSCASSVSEETDPTIKPHSYEEVSEKMINWTDTFSKEDSYCVYFFSRTCRYCDEIKDEVIEIALTHQTLIYFCNDNAIITDKYLDVKSTIGIGDINEFRIKGFPTIIRVENHLVKEHCPGKSATLEYVRTLA